MSLSLIALQFIIGFSAQASMSSCIDSAIHSHEIDVVRETVPTGFQMRAFDSISMCGGETISAVVTTPPSVSQLNVTLSYLDIQGIAPVVLQNIQPVAPGVFPLPLDKAAQSYVLKGNTMRVSLETENFPQTDFLLQQ